MVTNTTINGRIVTVTFSKAMRPSTVNASTVWLSYQPPGGGPAINLNNNPGVKVTYNPTTFTVTLDYSALSQTQMPSGQYYLVVLGGNINPATGLPGPGVTDLVGNYLDGVFHGTFPSGGGDHLEIDPTTGLPVLDANGNPIHIRAADENFVQPIGPVTLAAPVITSIQLQPSSDSGIAGDQNTNNSRPSFIGQVSSSFPGALAGLTVYIEFSALHGGALNLGTGLNGRGFVGNYDVTATTDANGAFTFQAPLFLPEGYNLIRAVVVGQADQPPLPGLSSAYNSAFRIDLTSPYVAQATLTPGSAPLALPGKGVTNLQSLTTLSLDVVDPNNPPTGPLATPPSILFPALDPATATNISNYSLISAGPDGVFGTADDVDYSSFITGATWVATGINPTTGLPDYVTTPPGRILSSDPNTGRVDLTFQAGLPQGKYELIAHTTETVNLPQANGTTVAKTFPGLLDAAGNPLDNSAVTGNTSVAPYSPKDFFVQFNIQPVPAYITSVTTNVNNAQGNTLLPRSYYEINPRAGDIVNNPPTTFYVDFSNPLATVDPQGNPIDFSDAIELMRTADTSISQPDGDFGNLGVAGIISASSPGSRKGSRRSRGRP